MKKEVAELCGAIIGDGWIDARKSNLFISGHPTEDREYYDKRIVQLLEKKFGRKIETAEFPYWGTYGVGIYRKKEVQKFIQLGIPTGKKGTLVDIPTEIKTSNIQTKKNFIRGLFDTDGTVYFMKQNGKYTRARLRIASISKELINSVKSISKQLGMRYSNPSPNKTGKGRPNKMYIFEINRKDDIDKWFSVIKPSNPKHLTKYMLWKKAGVVKPGTTLEERNKILSHFAKLKTA